MKRKSGEASAGSPRILEAAVVPICRDGDAVSVCLITSVKKKRWILPKGIIDPGETPEEAALKEAFEEAGLSGTIVGDSLGSFQDTKWNTAIEVTVFLMEVKAWLDRWGESHLRKRCFVPLGKAKKLVKKPALKEMLNRAAKRMAKGEGSGE